MDFTADFWTPVKHWAALWISMRHHLPWGVAFLFPCSSQIKPCFVSSHSLRPVVRKTGNLSISSSSSECWKGTRVKVSAVLASVPVQSCYKHLALRFFFFFFSSFYFPFFPFLSCPFFSLSPPVPSGSFASNGWKAKSGNLSAAPYLLLPSRPLK